ncbi:MAG: hypothetical protein IJQ84_07065 [Paludibacteraceae bacterium]|nr:hypothetical protein [Paludibacteraceae bacterium]MBQ6724249.1 hypothetical protein [Paludibacteraceae bacterium]
MQHSKYSYYKELAFSKGTPTAFIVDSPLQILCAAEAIKEFEIEDYLLIIGIEPNDSRVVQVMEMLRMMQLKYRTIEADNIAEIYLDLFASKGIFQEKESIRYRRIMVGDYYALGQRALGVHYATEDSVIVYLDDGCATIAMLNGIMSNTEEPTDWGMKEVWRRTTYKPYMDKKKRIDHIFKQKGIYDNDFLFSLFHYTQNRKVCIYPNKFSNIHAIFDKPNGDNAVYIVGPSIKSRTNGLKPEIFEAIIWAKLVDVRKRYPNAEIVYIPHGRDTDEYVPLFCEMLTIKYKRLSCAIEYYFLTKGIRPFAIYGFLSSALWTLKKISPDTIVTNWLIDNHNAPGWRADERITQYYENYGGILTEKIPYPNQTNWKQIKHFVKWVVGWYHWQYVLKK